MIRLLIFGQRSSPLANNTRVPLGPAAQVLSAIHVYASTKYVPKNPPKRSLPGEIEFVEFANCFTTNRARIAKQDLNMIRAWNEPRDRFGRCRILTGAEVEQSPQRPANFQAPREGGRQIFVSRIKRKTNLPMSLAVIWESHHYILIWKRWQIIVLENPVLNDATSLL